MNWDEYVSEAVKLLIIIGLCLAFYVVTPLKRNRGGIFQTSPINEKETV